MKNAICYFFSFLVEAIILWQYSSNLFSAKRKLLVKLIALCCLYFILFFCSLFESIWLNVAFYFLLNFIFLVIQFYLNWYTAFIYPDSSYVHERVDSIWNYQAVCSSFP